MSDRRTDLVPHRLTDWEQRTEMPLFAASLLFLTGCAVRVLSAHDTGPWRDIALALVGSTWLLFLMDYVVRLRLSGLGRRFVRTHWLDTVVLVLPLLRPLRMIKVYTAVQHRRDRPRLSLYARVMTYAGVSALLLGFSAALAVGRAAGRSRRAPRSVPSGTRRGGRARRSRRWAMGTPPRSRRAAGRSRRG